MKGFIRKIWDAIVSFVCNIPYDKLLHFIAGLVISAIFYIDLKMVPCIVPAIAAGVIKEFFDMWTTDQADWKDLVATVAGGALIQLLVIFA